MDETWHVILALAAATLVIRIGGFVLATRMPTTGPWAAGFEALPGCLIASLLTVILIQGSWIEWSGATIALLVAVATRSLLLTMVVGIATVWFLRQTGL